MVIVRAWSHIKESDKKREVMQKSTETLSWWLALRERWEKMTRRACQAKYHNIACLQERQRMNEAHINSSRETAKNAGLSDRQKDSVTEKTQIWSEHEHKTEDCNLLLSSLYIFLFLER